jgi:hypothetical protein
VRSAPVSIRPDLILFAARRLATSAFAANIAPKPTQSGPLAVILRMGVP